MNTAPWFLGTSEHDLDSITLILKTVPHLNDKN